MKFETIELEKVCQVDVNVIHVCVKEKKKKGKDYNYCGYQCIVVFTVFVWNPLTLQHDLKFSL